MARLVRRRRDRLRPPRRRRAWSARRRSAPRSRRCSRNGTIDAEPRTRAPRSTPHSSAVHSVLERIRVIDAGGRAVRLGRRHQRLREVGAGLAPGRAPRQPGHAARGAGHRRDRVDPALTRRRRMDDFRAPRWLPGGHVQTIWPALFSRRYRRRRAGVPARALDRRPTATSSTSTGRARTPAPTAARALPRPRRLVVEPLRAGLRAPRRAQRGWRFAVPHFRGCSGELNLAPRAYHSGDYEEVGWMLARFRALHARADRRGRRLARRQRAAALGRGGRRERPRRRVRAVAAVSAPLDLAAGGRAIGRGFGRQVYTRMFLRTMKPKALRKLAPAPGPVRRASGCARRATCTTSTTSSPRRCTAFATPTTTTRAARPSRSCAASASRRWCSTRATIRSCRRRRCRGRREVGAVRHALAAGARRPRRLRRRRAGRAICRPCPSSVAGWLGAAPLSASRAADNRAHGRHRRRRAEEVAQRAALLRLARARRARRLVHARRPHPGRRAVPARQGQPHRAREAARVHRPQLRAATTAGAWFFQNGPQRVYVELEAAPWVWRLQRRAARRAVDHQPHRARGAASARPSSTRRAGSSSPPTSASASSTRSTWKRAADAVERGVWTPTDARFAALAERFGYRLSPAAATARAGARKSRREAG